VHRFEAIVVDFVTWHVACHTEARVAQYELAALTPEHRKVILRIRRDTRACLHEVVVEGVRTGAFSAPDADVVVRAVLSLGIDVARWYDPNGSLTGDEISKQYLPLALRMAGHSLD
jgi:hypothetical protein